MRRALVRSLAHNVLVILSLAAVLLCGMATQGKTGFEPAAPVGSARALVEANGCGDNVPDPARVVVTVKGVTQIRGQRMTDLAIEQAMFGIDHGLTVHGFCAAA